MAYVQQIRLDDETRERWTAAAAAHGVSVSELVREAVEHWITPAMVATLEGVDVLEQPKPKPATAAPQPRRSTLIPDGYRCPMPNPTVPGTRCIRCGEPHERA